MNDRGVKSDRLNVLTESSGIEPDPFRSDPRIGPFPEITEEGPLSRCFFGSLALLLALLINVPLTPKFAVDAYLDTSWCLFYHYSFRSGIQFGRNLLFEYGPWGFCLSEYYMPKTFGWMLAARAIIGTGIFAGIWQLKKNLGLHSIFAALWLVAVVMWGNLVPAHDGLLFAICLLPVLIVATEKEGTRRIGWEIILLAAGLAMTALCKFSYMMLASGTIGLASLFEIFWRRKAPWMGFLYIGALIVGWAVATQSIFNLPRYVITSWLLARDYSMAMSIIGADSFMVPVFVSLCVCITLWLTMIFWRGNRVLALMIFISTAVTLFFCFKEGFTRYDGHEFMGTSGLVTVTFIILPIVWKASRRDWQRIAAVILAMASVWCLQETYVRFFNLQLNAGISTGIEIIKARLSNGYQWIANKGHIPSFDQTYEQDNAIIRASCPLPQLTGPVNVVGDFQEAAIAAGMDLKTQPVFQSYAASNRRLQEANRLSLSGPDAVENVLFGITILDGRYPSLDGGLSWPQLISSYDITDFSHDILVMRRAEHPRDWSLQSLGTVSCVLNQDVDVPDLGDVPIWANIEVQPTLIGSLESTLLRGVEVDMNVVTDNDEKLQFRIIPGMAASGFLLSPLVQDTRDFTALAGRSNRPVKLLHKIRQISIVLPHTSYPSWLIKSPLEVHFSRLNIEQQNFDHIPTLQAVANLMEMGASHVPSLTGTIFSLPDGASALYSHPLCAEKLAVPAEVTRVEFQYGLMPTVWDKTHGVLFRLSALQPDGSKQLLWTQSVMPMTCPEDRAQLRTSVNIPAKTSSLLFETLPVETFDYCWAYWGDVKFQYPVANDELPGRP